MMGFLTPKAPEMPKITPITAAPTKITQAESEAARQDLIERMKRAEMSRQKSVLKLPALVKPGETNNRNMLSSFLG
jgi:hypothetical protein